MTRWVVKKICEECHKEYDAPRKEQKYCSPECFQKQPKKFKKFIYNKETLYKLYVTDKLSMYKIADKLKYGPNTIKYYLNKWEIPSRDKSQAQSGCLNHTYKGYTSDGKYIIRHIDSFDKKYYDLLKPMCIKSQVREHRAFMAIYLNRSLKRYEVIHHKNGNKKDNRIDNLELLVPRTHNISKHPVVCQCPHCNEIFELKGNTYLDYKEIRVSL